MPSPNHPHRQIRAAYTEQTVTVYQAYSPEIAEPALAAGTFVPPFKLGRMTWIKPSFLWMMYRSGWAEKPDQERVLAIDITRDGFEWALAHAALSSFEPDTYASHDEWLERKRNSPVRIQWDPERSLTLAPEPWRAIQIGLSAEAADRYVHEWITAITDVTPTAHRIHDLVRSGDKPAAAALLPAERPYEVPAVIARHIGIALSANWQPSARGTRNPIPAAAGAGGQLVGRTHGREPEDLEVPGAAGHRRRY